MNIAFILTDDVLTIWPGGRTLSLDRNACGENTWTRALHALANNDLTSLCRIIDVAGSLTDHFSSELQVINGQVVYRGTVLDDRTCRQAIQFMRQGLPYRPLLKFIERLQKNPSYRAVQELHDFLAAGRMPITSEGYFLAYKKVTRDPANPERLIDIYTGTMDNSPGQYVTMPRNMVDEDPNHTCSHGLHVCSYGYLQHYGSSDNWNTVVVVEIDPADVVAVPKDYNNQKMRVCAYHVIKEVPEYSELGHDKILGRHTILDNIDDDCESDEDDTQLRHEWAIEATNGRTDLSFTDWKAFRHP